MSTRAFVPPPQSTTPNSNGANPVTESHATVSGHAVTTPPAQHESEQKHLEDIHEELFGGDFDSISDLERLESPRTAQNDAMARLRAPPSPQKPRPQAKTVQSHDGPSNCSSRTAVGPCADAAKPLKAPLDFHEQPKTPHSNNRLKAPPAMFGVVDLTEDEVKFDVKKVKSVQTLPQRESPSKHPSARAGIKRNSEEFERDMISPVHSIRPSPPREGDESLGTSLNEHPKDPPPPYSTSAQQGEKIVCPELLNPPTLSVRLPDAVAPQSRCHETTSRHSPDTSYVSEDSKERYDSTESDTGSQASIAVTARTRKSPRKGTESERKQVKQSLKFDTERQHTRAKRGSISESEGTYSETTDGEEPMVQVKKSPVRLDHSSPRKMHDAQKANDSSTVLQSSPYRPKERVPPNAFTAAQTSPKPPSTQALTGFTIENPLPTLKPLGDNQALGRFCALPVERLNAHWKCLLEGHRTALKDLCDNVDDDEKEMQMRPFLTAAKAKLAAFKTLMGARKELVDLMSRRAATQAEIREFLADHETTDPEYDLIRKRLTELKKPINEQESMIRSLVYECGIDTAHSNQISSKDAYRKDTQNQISRPQQSEPAISWPSDPVDVDASHMVRQTQAHVVQRNEQPPLRRPIPAPPAASLHQISDAPDVQDDYYGDDFDEDDFSDMNETSVNEIRPAVPPTNMMGRSILQERSVNEMGPPARRNANKPDDHAVRKMEMNHAWSREVHDKMRNTFHMKGFRENQLNAINATLAAKDVFVLMPTGGGKSLCYQLPAIITSGNTHGVTIVISPLVSLMEDQVAHLEKLNINAKYINSSVNYQIRRHILDALRTSEPERFVQLLYITPEMLQKSGVLMSALEALHANGKFARLVIDEAHCVSQWGHDFRPDYKLIGEVRQRVRGVPLMALTATATPNVKADVMANLDIEGCEVFTQSFNRENLHYEVRKKQKDVKLNEEILDLIKTFHHRQTGIIYCLSRKTCEKVAEFLVGKGIKAHHYHAHVSAEEKSQIQRDWQSGKYHVIVATIAFGMGIDKPDVRYVIHHSMPKNLEGYYQETGRAGRDGKKSMCYLFYTFGDFKIMKKMIEEGDGNPEQKQRLMDMLKTMIRFCDNRSDCRRKQVLSYFGEHHFDRKDCNGFCDNCNSNARFEEHDFTNLARQAVDLVRAGVEESKSGSKPMTQTAYIELFTGYRGKKEEWQLALPGFGAGSELERGAAERIFQRLIMDEVFVEYSVTNRGKFPVTYLRLGRRSTLLDRTNYRLKLVVRVEGSSAKKTKRVKNVVDEEDEAYIASAPEPKKAKVISRNNHAASTYVSSPLQAPKSRAGPEPRNLQDFAYEESESDDAFEPVRAARTTSKSRKGQPSFGPPIEVDEQLAELSEFHRKLVLGFVPKARKLCQEIMKKHNLSRVPFSETVLRQWAIEWPEELHSVRGASHDKVKLFGAPFKKLLEPYANRYRQFMSRDYGVMNTAVSGQNKIVDLVSDDEGLGDVDGDAEYIPDDAAAGTTSHFFQPRQAVQSQPLLHSQTMQNETQDSLVMLEDLNEEDFSDFEDDPATKRANESVGKGKGRVSSRGGGNFGGARKRRSTSASTTASTTAKRNSFKGGAAKKSKAPRAFPAARKSAAASGDGSKSSKKKGGAQATIGRGGGGGLAISAMPI